MNVLMMLPELPFDPTSGAALSMNTMCEFLAAAGMKVTVLATSATDQHVFDDVLAYFATLGIEPETDRSGPRPVHRLTRRGVDYAILDIGATRTMACPPDAVPQLDALFEHHLHSPKPDVLLAFGGTPVDRARYARAQGAGVVVVLGVRNHGYLNKWAFENVDAALMPSEFMVRHYFDHVGIRAFALPAPLALDDVLAPERDPVFITYINPSREKGLAFFARLADELATHRPDIPMLVVESRGRAGALVAAGHAAGLDLARHASIMTSPGAPHPRDIFANTRILLAPSLWLEPGGRVGAEALVNGIPPIVSDRGGLPETVGDGGFVLPVPADLQPDSTRAVTSAEVASWFELIERLVDDIPFYESASNRALAAAKRYHPHTLIPAYASYFSQVASGQHRLR